MKQTSNLLTILIFISLSESPAHDLDKEIRVKSEIFSNIVDTRQNELLFLLNNGLLGAIIEKLKRLLGMKNQKY